METPSPPDRFQQAIEDWRKKHKLRDDEPLLLCLELFRIHQSQWDRIRREELPSFSEFRESLIQLHQRTSTFQRQAGALTEELRRYKSATRLVAPSVSGLVLTALFALLTGILIGRFLL
jgi:hypothetical protein